MMLTASYMRHIILKRHLIWISEQQYFATKLFGVLKMAYFDLNKKKIVCLEYVCVCV